MRVLTAMLLLAWGCGPQPSRDAQLTVQLLRGQADPFDDPGNATRSAAKVGSFEVRWREAARKQTEIAAYSGKQLSVRLQVTPPVDGVLELVGLRASDSRPYSFGRSLPLKVTATEPVTAKVLLAPIEAFTQVGDAALAEREGAMLVSLGSGALLLGGVARGTTTAASPYAARFTIDGVQVCATSDACLSGTAVPPRTEGFALEVPEGVLHGMGRLAGGALDATLYLTRPDGSTSQLSWSGDALPPLAGARGVLLPGGAVLLVGGHDGTNASTALYTLEVATSTATHLAAPLLEGRKNPALAVVGAGQVLVAGGEGDSGALSTAELYTLGMGALPLDGGQFAQVRKQLKVARARPYAVRLSDDSVLVASSESAQVDVFQLAFGLRVGGFIDLSAPPPLLALASAVPMGLSTGEVLFVGQRSGAPGAMAFLPDPDQIPSPSSPDYTGTFREIEPPLDAQPGASQARLGDGAWLWYGGGTRFEWFRSAPTD